MREVNPDLIKAHTAVRFRSEYDYALFEYYRSAKVIAFLESAGVKLAGRALDCGCGGGGMPLSLAEHVDEVVGIDPFDRFRDAGVTLARERGLSNIRFARADGMALPFPSRSFDLVLSHAVIEHVADAALYLRECRRVLGDKGRLYLSTAPYLSFAGAHLPRLLVPIPLHLLAGRRLSFQTFRWLARHAPWALKEKAYREHVHPQRPARDRERRRPPGEGSGPAAPRPDRARRPAHRARTALAHRDGAPFAASGGEMAHRERRDAGHPSVEHRVRAGASRGHPISAKPVRSAELRCDGTFRRDARRR